MIKWLKNLFKKQEPKATSFIWGDISGVVCYQDDVDELYRKRKYYNVRDKKGRFTKLKGKKNG